MTTNVFMILTAYYLLKVAREPLILLGAGAEVKSYAAVGQAVLLIPVTSLYGWLAGRIRPFVLLTCVTLFFGANLGLFWLLGLSGVRIGVPFFLWVGIFNLVTVTQFWSFAADSYTEEQGKRLFPIIGIGSSVGAIGGAALAGRLMATTSPPFLMIVAAVILVLALGITYLVHPGERARAAGATDPRQEPVPRGSSFSLVARDPYLLLIAGLILLLNISTKTGDYVLDKMLTAHAAERALDLGVSTTAYVGQFKARYFEWINVLEVLLQSLAVSRIIKYAGIRVALIAVPLVSLIGYATTSALPLIGILMATRVAENSLDYSLSQTVRQALWLVTSREAKYKAKQVVDSFVWRAGDSMSAVVVWTGVHLGASLRWFLAVNTTVAVAWVGIALLLGRQYARRRR